MFQHILVPLDGSPLAEHALPVAQQIALAQGAEIILLRVIEPLPWALEEGAQPPGAYQELAEILRDEALNSVSQQAESWRRLAIPTRFEVRHGFAASEILGLEKDGGIDLVVMATHSRGGLARMALGSVADRVVREGTSPVLLVRASRRTGSALTSALVPLDGSALAESALALAEGLAGRPLMRVHLLRVVASVEDQPSARPYLENLRARLLAAGLVVSWSVRIGDPAVVIEEEARLVDLVILATHGRGGLDRLRHGSVAERATRDLPTPTLLLRPAAMEARVPWPLVAMGGPEGEAA